MNMQSVFVFDVLSFGNKSVFTFVNRIGLRLAY